MMRLPAARGALSAALLRALAQPTPGDRLPTSWAEPEPDGEADAAITLWTLQELGYRGFADVDETWEWHPDLVALRVALERDLEVRLRKRWADEGHAATAADPAVALFDLIDQHDGPSLARHLHHHGTVEQAHELLRQRSIYHLKEADPTSWVLPRLGTRVKAALMTIQFDEYGAGDPTRLHHHLFERGLAAAGIEAGYGAHIDEALPAVLEQNCALTMFGLHRRLRGSALGHLAAVEATSSLPSQQLAQAFTRLGLPAAMVAYYDEHIEADAVHEQLAVRDVCAALVAEEPQLLDDVLFGAWTCLDLEARTATALLSRWGVPE